MTARDPEAEPRPNREPEPMPNRETAAAEPASGLRDPETDPRRA